MKRIKSRERIIGTLSFVSEENETRIFRLVSKLMFFLISFSASLGAVVNIL